MPTYQDLFDAVIGTEPPATLDIDEMMARSRRRLRRRRAVEAGAVALAVAVVAIGVSGVTGHWPAAGPLRTPPVGNSSDTHPTSTPTRTLPPPRVPGPEPTEPASAADGRITAAMQAAVVRVVPGGRLLPYVSGGQYPFELAPWTQDEPTLPYRGYAHLLVDGRSGATTITIEVGVIGSQQRPTCAGKPDCAETIGPAGERIIALTTTTTRGGASPRADLVAQVPGVEHTVWVEHAAGDYVKVDHHNWPEGGDPPFAPPLLTREELVQIALDPALTLYP